MIPDFVTHYHLPDRAPFLSLSDLNGDIGHPVFVEMLTKHARDPSYNRRYGKKYLDIRKETEAKLRRLFEERGGRPRRSSPLYFILGASSWFRHLNRDHKEIAVPLSELPRDATSVTFPDSYIAMHRSDKPYFEKVYLLHELPDVIDLYGTPEDAQPETYDSYWLGDFEKYIEIQVWDDAVAAPHRQAWQAEGPTGETDVPASGRS